MIDLRKIVFVPKTPTANCFSDDTLVCSGAEYDAVNDRYTINVTKQRSLREIKINFQIK